MAEEKRFGALFAFCDIINMPNGPEWFTCPVFHPVSSHFLPFPTIGDDWGNGDY